MDSVLGSEQGLKILGELLGTFVLVLLGNGVCGAVNYKNMHASKTKPTWLLIAFGWGIAVLLGVLVAEAFSSGGMINPAVTLFALISNFSKAGDGTDAGFMILNFVLYITAQLLGAMLAQIILNLLNWHHIKENEAEKFKGSSCTHASHPDKVFNNMGYEYVATLVLVGFVLATEHISSMAAFPVTKYLLIMFMITGLVISLGSVTGCSLNPARDLGPRIVYSASMKIFKNKIENPVSADFKYGLLVAALAPLLAGGTMGAIGLLINLY